MSPLERSFLTSWASWVAATSLGASFFGALQRWLTPHIATALETTSIAAFSQLVAFWVTATLAGFVLATAQWLVLRRVALPSVSWIWTTTGACFAGCLAAFMAVNAAEVPVWFLWLVTSQPWTGGVVLGGAAGFLIGCVLGAAQRHALPTSARGASHWVTSCALAGAAAGASVAATYFELDARVWPNRLAGPTGSPLFTPGLWGLGGLVFGALTGVTLYRTLRPLVGDPADGEASRSGAPGPGQERHLRTARRLALVMAAGAIALVLAGARPTLEHLARVRKSHEYDRHYQALRADALKTLVPGAGRANAEAFFTKWHLDFEYEPHNRLLGGPAVRASFFQDQIGFYTGSIHATVALDAQDRVLSAELNRSFTGP